ncbi:MAG: ribosome-associated translation inhibitor RaiA [Firmicutes bacterium]|nr:ribosome-associated translation inhibitor RaiA [Bacillota bacterium]
MQVTITGKNIEITDALREYAEKKAAKISKFFEKGPIEAKVTLSTERDKHVVDIIVSINGLLLKGEEKTGDMYSSIDGAIDKVERQILKYKTRINRKLHATDNRVVIASAPLSSEEAPAVPVIKRTKKFAVKPMKAEEAVMQMDFLGHDFYVFRNCETEEVNVVYRRKDGAYGLIEPEF